MDWSVGEYEQVAAELLPAAEVVVDRAGPVPGEHVVDVGCGTGNAALLAAERGARVTGIDPAQRLLDVASAEGAGRELDATFIPGEATRLPLEGSSADAVVSVFGVIFASDAAAAAAELARITAPGGRIVFSAWIPGGALGDVTRVRRQATLPPGAPSGPAPFAWHDPAAATRLFAPFGFSIEAEERELAFTAASPRAFMDSELSVNPVWIAARRLLEPRGELRALRDHAVEILEAANEDPGAFRVASRYVVSTARRNPEADQSAREDHQ
jgi:SAM-dependent methyltransferase